MIAIETKGMIGSKIPPRAMWLTLLDSAKKEIESELVPFADSYNVSTLVVKMTIVLIKYQFVFDRKPFCQPWRSFQNN